MPNHAVPRPKCALPTHRSADAIGCNSVHGSSVALREFCLLGGAGRPGSAMMRVGLGLGVRCKIVVGRRAVDRLPCVTLACIWANIRLKRRIEAVVDFLIEIKAAALIPSVVYAGPGTIPTRTIAQCGAAYVAVPKPRFLRSLGGGCCGPAWRSPGASGRMQGTNVRWLRFEMCQVMKEGGRRSVFCSTKRVAHTTERRCVVCPIPCNFGLP